MQKRGTLLAMVVSVVLGATAGPLSSGLAQPAANKVLREYAPPLTEAALTNDRVELIGPEADACVKFEPTGLRIKLPKGHDGWRTDTGVRLNLEIQGDFEITAAFELLHEPEPMDVGLGARLSLGLWMQAPEFHRNTTLSRARSAKGVTQFTAWAPALVDAKGKKLQRILYAPTAAKSGRLRVVRQGTAFAYFVAEGAGDEFRFLSRYALNEGPVTMIRLVAATGGPEAAVDVRFTDLRVRAESFPDQPGGQGANPADAADVDTPAGLTGWQMALITSCAAIAVLLVLGLGGFAYWRSRRPAAVRADIAGAKSSCVEFACTHCKRAIKVETRMAGKKVRCGQCRTVVIVPEPAQDRC
jgi:hypothetical protein